MNTIFDALNPENQNDVIDCCNGNLKCREDEFSKKCVSGTSGRTFSFNPPELTCDISIENRKFIFLAGVKFTDFLNLQTSQLIQSIKNNDFTEFAMTIAPGSFITIFNTSNRLSVFSNSPLDLLPFYEEAANLYTIAASSASSGNAILFLRSTIKNILTASAFKTITKNMSKGVITPHANTNYTIASSYGSTLTAETIINNACADPTSLTNKYLIFNVQIA
jgi:hypothetical protein